MFEQIGRAIDELIETVYYAIARTRLYRKVYAPCFVSVYLWLYPERLTREFAEVFHRCGLITSKQYKKYSERAYLLAEREGMKEV
jgi:hypothetical protein